MDSVDYYYEKTPHSTAILCVLFFTLCVPVVWVGVVASWKTSLIPLVVLLLIFVPAVLQDRTRRAHQNAPALSLQRELLVAKCKAKTSLENIPYDVLKSITYETGKGYRYLTIRYLHQDEERSIDVDLAGVGTDGDVILQEVCKRVPTSNNPRIAPRLLLCSPSKRTSAAS